MKNLKKILGLVFMAVILLSAIRTFAEELPAPELPGNENITEEPPVTEEDVPEETPENTYVPLDLSISVSVPYTCEVKDSDNVSHSYSATSPDEYIAICALEAALEDGSLDSAVFSNAFPDMGLFVTALNGVEADPSSQYWSLYHNGGFADLGISSLPVASGDSIALKLFDFDGNEIGDSVEINIASLIPVATENGSGNSSGSSHNKNKKDDGEVLGAEIAPIFDLKKAYAFLLAQQKPDGSFGEDIFTDWTAIALGGSDQTYPIQPIVKLVKFLSEHKPQGENLTDYERRALALMALGLDPYTTNGENYIQKIVNAFDGRQFGDPNEDNDDIFAILALSGAGYNADEEMMTKSLNFVLERQKEDGSWDKSIDMTGVALQALALFPKNENALKAVAAAKELLKGTQKENASWNDDPSSTAWVLSGISAIGEKTTDWDTKYHDTLSFFASLQDADGGIKDDLLSNKIWKTAYTASALSGKSWTDSIQKFEKKAPTIIASAPKKEVMAPKPKSPAPKEKFESAVQNVPSLDLANISPDPLPTPTEKPAPETNPESWFSRLLGKLFGY